MKFKFIYILIPICIFLYINTIPRVNAADTYIYLEPETYEAEEIGEEITFSLKIENIEQLQGYSTIISWDPNYLEFESITQGPFLSSIGMTIFQPSNVKDGDTEVKGFDYTGRKQTLPGRHFIIINDMLFNKKSDGSGNLANITLRLLKETISTEIKIEDQDFGENSPRFYDIEQEVIPVTVKNNAEISFSSGILLAYAGEDIIADEDSTVTLNCSKSVGTNLNYTWSFDDNGTKELTGETVEYYFEKPGVYNVTLVVKDNDSDSYDWITVTVKDVTAPVAVMELSGFNELFEITTEANFNYKSMSYDPEGGKIVSQKWSMGDGNTMALKSGSYRYTNTGSHEIILNVTDSEGNWDIAKQQVKVILPDINEEAQDMSLYTEAILVIMSLLTIYSTKKLVNASDIDLNKLKFRQIKNTPLNFLR